MSDEDDRDDLGYVSMDTPWALEADRRSLWVEDDQNVTWADAIVPKKNRGLFISACGNFACAYNFGVID